MTIQKFQALLEQFQVSKIELDDFCSRVLEILFQLYILFESASAATLKDSASMWTSGANEGEHCDVEKVYSWCADGTRVKRQELSSLPWADGNSPEANERCLSLNIKDSKFALDYVDCRATKYAVCEVKRHFK
jgi:hypothetical protein